MFYLLLKRAVRVARDGGTDRFAARTTTQIDWNVSGPFTKRGLAERGAVRALGSGTCLVAQVLTQDQLEAMTTQVQEDYQLDKVLRRAVKMFVPKLPAPA